MTLSATRRFAFSLIATWYITILVFTILNVYSIEVFFGVAVAELFIIATLTKPFHYTAAWRRNLTLFMCIFLVGVAIIVGQHILTVLQSRQ